MAREIACRQLDGLPLALEMAAAQIEAAVGVERMQFLVQEGRSLTDAVALELACRD